METVHANEHAPCIHKMNNPGKLTKRNEKLFTIKCPIQTPPWLTGSLSGYLTADCHFQHLFGKEIYKSSDYVVPVNALRDDYLAVMRSSHKAASELTPQKLMAALNINVIITLFLDNVFEMNNSCLAMIRGSNRNHYFCIYLKESQLLPALLTLWLSTNLYLVT